MFRQRFNIPLARRVTAYYLLFCLLTTAWFTVGALFIGRSVLNAHAESDCLLKLGRVSNTVQLELRKNDAANLQRLAERIRAESSLNYCAVVSADGLVLAHSNASLVGESYQAPVGERKQWDSIQRVRYVATDSQPLREYRAPLGSDNGSPALHIAVAEAGFFAPSSRAVPHALFLVMGAALFIGAGALVVYRNVQPLTQIDAQLCDVARQTSPSQFTLATVLPRGAASVGWNRLVTEKMTGTEQPSLHERLAGAVQGLGRQKADDILNSLADGIAVTKAVGTIEFVNQAAVAILAPGSGADALLGRTVESCFDFADQDAARNALLDPQAKSRSVVAELARTNGGEKQVLRVARHPFRTADKKSGAGFVWSVRDITQQKLAEKMRDQFLDAATHELRTPLANIRAYAETLMLSEVPDVEQQKQFYNTINSEAIRLSRFIDDLLSVSSIEGGALALDRQSVHVDRLLNEAINKVRPQMDQKSITFDCTLPEKMPELLLDKDKLTAALVNLLGNAAKYTPAGGRIMLNVKISAEQLQIDVQDSGIGIAEDELAKVFEKFFRSNDPRVREENGTGLGLPFALEVARLHGGTLTATSQLDKGSTFTITIPLK